MNRKIKIAVNILMLFAVIGSYVRWDSNLTFHVIAGCVCSLLFAIHFCLNRKTFTVFAKNIKNLNTQTKLKYFISLLLLVVWSIVIILGIFALLSYIEIMNITFNIGRFHGIFARVGGVLIIIHIFQHGKQIISYIRQYPIK